MPCRTLRHAAVGFAFTVLSGCPPVQRTDPVAGLTRTIFPSMGRLSDAGVQAQFVKPITWSSPVRASLLWVDDRSAWNVTLTEAERTRLLQEFGRRLRRPPLHTVSIVPTVVTLGGTGKTDLSALRSAAARFQSDLLVLLTTRTDAYSDKNILAVSYVALIPALFMPAHDLAVYTGAEACILDVRGGVFLACAQGRGQATRRFVTPFDQAVRMRALVAAATGAALAAIPADLNSALLGRLQGERSRPAAVREHHVPPTAGPVPMPDGIWYETVGD